MPQASANRWYSINGVVVPSPHLVAHQPYKATPGLSGAPIRTGWRQMVWTWHVMDPQEAATILALYDRAHPVVAINYLDTEVGWATDTAVLYEPNTGNRNVAVWNEFNLQFEHWTDTHPTWPSLDNR